jgi:GNAT superfamily N-acetyltransferase
VGLLIRRLDHRDQVDNFDCGDTALNDYLRRYAWQNQVRYQVGVTHVAVDEDIQVSVIGYHTLATTGIPKDALLASSEFGPYQSVPAVLLGRLAVDRRFKGHRVGQALLADALDRALALRQSIGCRCVIVDAYPTAVAWYQKYGFAALPSLPHSRTQRMFIDLRTVERAKA